jgi:hypothetical protein
MKIAMSVKFVSGTKIVNIMDNRTKFQNLDMLDGRHDSSSRAPALHA